MGDEGAHWQRIVYEKNNKFYKACRKQGHSEEDCRRRKPQENMENRDLIPKEAKGTQSQLKISNVPQQQTWKLQYRQKQIVGQLGNSVNVQDTMEQLQEMYEEDTVRVMETGDHSRKDNSSFSQADTRSPTDRTEEIHEANKETLDITEEEIRDTRKETLEKTMEDVWKTSKEALETVTMTNPNDQLKMQNSDSFLVERDYSCAENLGLPQDDERGLICAKLPPDKGFYSVEEIGNNREYVEIGSLNSDNNESFEIDLQVNDSTHSMITRSKSRRQSTSQISHD
ncbi:unnamed protein product [Ilex paraguariensis]|uniref:Uncharacterized protein n=1 Tax=Ilex paraguariensis TaxID=185542 RepID=A0ABC8S3W2_9AQUA